MVKMAKLALLVLVSFLLIIPTAYALGIAPAAYPDQIFQPDTVVSYNFWATNFNNDEELNISLSKGGTLSDYVILPSNKLTIPADSQVKFIVKLDYPSYLEPGDYDASITLTEIDPDATGYAVVVSNIYVKSELNFITECTEINESGLYYLSQDITGDSGTCLEITASDVEIKGQDHKIIGNDIRNSKGIYVHDVSNVEISDLEVSDWDWGINFLEVDDSKVSDSKIYDNNIGLYVQFITDSTFKDIELDNDGADIASDFTEDVSFTDILFKDTEVDFNLYGNFALKGVGPMEDPYGFNHIGKYLQIQDLAPDIIADGYIDLDIDYSGANLNGKDEKDIKMIVYDGIFWDTTPKRTVESYSIDQENDYVSTRLINVVGIYSLAVSDGTIPSDMDMPLVPFVGNAELNVVDYNDDAKKVDNQVIELKTNPLQNNNPVSDNQVSNSHAPARKSRVSLPTPTVEITEDVVVLEVVDVQVITNSDNADSPDNGLFSRFIFWLFDLF